MFMKMNPFISLTLLTVLPVVLLSQRATLNVVLVTADDLGMQLGCYGDDKARTPRIDRFAGEGMRFTQFHVAQSSCSSSRSSLLTGLYPHQSGQVGLANRGYSMRDGIETLPTLLKEAGYRTGIIGKLHVNPESAFAFDYKKTDPWATRGREGVNGMLAEFLDSTDAEPFFLMLNYMDPHAPFTQQIEGLPEEPREAHEVEPFGFQGRLDDPEHRQNIANFYSCIDRLDTLFGDFLDELDRRDLTNNTVVLFLSDNGPPFLLAKGAEYDASVRVPLIICWPGTGQTGVQSDALVSGVDVFATILDAAGLHTDAALPARSLRPILQGNPPGDWRKTVFTGFTAHQVDRFYPRRSVSDGRYRLVRNFLSGQTNPMDSMDGDETLQISKEERFEGTLVRKVYDRYRNPPALELYDLETDPHGYDNLIDNPDYEALRERFIRALKAWMSETDDHDPVGTFR